MIRFSTAGESHGEALIALVSGLLVFVLSFQDGVYATMKETTLRIFDGYAQLQPEGYAADPRLELAIINPSEVARAAEGVDGVTAAAPRVNGFAILANGPRSYAAAVVGVDPVGEAKISTIASRISDGRYLRADDTNQAILGDILAKNLGIAVGGKLTMLGSKPVDFGAGKREPSLILHPEGMRTEVFAGCNSMAGTYTLKGKDIHFSALAGTLMACDGPIMDIEKGFADALTEAHTWRITGKQLLLIDANSRAVAQFESRITH